MEDPSETAVSRDAEKEKSFAMEVKDGDATPKREASGAMPIISMPGDNDSTVTESQGNDDGIVVNGPVLGDEPQVNGEASAACLIGVEWVFLSLYNVDLGLKASDKIENGRIICAGVDLP